MKARNPIPPYATGKKVDGIIIVERDKDFDDNPLFYVNNEYPTNKVLENGFLIMDYEFYTDKSGNKYLVCGGNSDVIEKHIKDLIPKFDTNWARNVDEFVEGADKKSYEQWLDLIS